MTQFASGYDGGGYTATVADINRDGRADIAVINQHSRGEFAWYTGPLIQLKQVGLKMWSAPT